MTKPLRDPFPFLQCGPDGHGSLYPRARRRLTFDDPLFGSDDEGRKGDDRRWTNRVDDRAEKTALCYRAAVAGDAAGLICLSSACGLGFATARELQRHIAGAHLHRCLQCKSSFLVSEWVQQHAEEEHSQLFAAMVARNKASYRCWILGCPASFSNDSERERHIVLKHYVWKTNFSRAKGGMLRSLESVLEYTMAKLKNKDVSADSNQSEQKGPLGRDSMQVDDDISGNMTSSLAPPAVVCKFYHTPSGCREGERCRFRHEKGSEGMGSTVKSATTTSSVAAERHLRTKPCYYYFMTPGGCKLGSSCPFSHASSSAASAGSSSSLPTPEQQQERQVVDAAAALMMELEGEGNAHTATSAANAEDDELSQLMTSSLSISRRAPPAGTSLSFGHRRRGGGGGGGTGVVVGARSSRDTRQNQQPSSAERSNASGAPMASMPPTVGAPTVVAAAAAAPIMAAPAGSSKGGGGQSALLFRPRTLVAAKKPVTAAVTAAVGGPQPVAEGKSATEVVARGGTSTTTAAAMACE
jgi:hypothetical protein